MDLNTALNEMLTAIGTANDDIAAVLHVEPGHWAVGYTDDTTIEVECQPGSNRLTLFAGLGVPFASEIDRIRHTLLSYNLMWRETGGLRMGLSGVGDEAYLIGDVYLPETSEASLDQALFNLARLARIWTRFVTEGSLGPDTPDFAGTETLIRV
jgi:hypothetical protein